MPHPLILPDTYGYTALLAVGVIPLMSFLQGTTVTTFRKAANVPYPNPYATAEQCKSSQEAYQFNCAQRAHGNLLENMPQTIAMLLFAGLFYPTATPVLGAVWVVGRVLYAYGYITSKEGGKGRNVGGMFWIAQLGLLGLCVSAGLKLL
ncbi:Microsomal glutathione S-transferase 3 [Fulvia fulva]|uniref:Microsomal glutathione S-transferase 3 n=1 Tax=Passalora fulva TaxID=5499 RepID=A0A9Q8PLY0_PASFU|nr:Microsomal glutathione S-transferase 3 [Fulvia fulva]KAK4609200.1 Microsomal glutathione S-transferase 3 [Fulvia fulva]KAK4609502.1 Microsomal glutathione S-transferase 3 [Fulvia fulva]UJO24857.1 Microsomal glutathione S-transferase 3 [Fulvia fulva]WPV22761.1 Microsomal glutathione S-transferase 3 [Fulvia fulva]WPV37651.1 Microsomal glutathione S-transferase 3 [Fulvia fulva]